jgi:hypothetical protein
MSGSGDIFNNRIIDEALKHVSNNKVRIEDLNRMAENTSDLIDNLARDVLIKIVDDIKQQNEWSMQRGGPPPDFVKIQFTIQGRIMAFMTTLLRKWEYVSTEFMGEHAIKEMKKILDDKK